MTIHKTDEEIEKDVKEKLLFEPQLDESKINVSIKNGVITLLGSVGTYLEKCATERSVRSVEGVKGIANDLKVDISAKYKKTDTEIASASINALQWNVAVPEGDIKVTVEDGCVTLSGKVGWWYQKHEAEKVIKRLSGVKSINNLITLYTNVTPTEVKKSIMKEFHRNATIDADKINVVVEGSKVILSGQVKSWVETKEARRAAWALPGVTQVEDHLTIG